MPSGRYEFPSSILSSLDDAAILYARSWLQLEQNLELRAKWVRVTRLAYRSAAHSHLCVRGKSSPILKKVIRSEHLPAVCPYRVINIAE
ncbi:hypothetical protein CEXT_406481 [Caerostris extrusa]|uniref:Uncharacterized protein n=1 Tax=Caerostris extrusa TaxID=172846 RepID=A0AAV4MWD2_CAEEX|nr:hypothetical protein CEXT_406481 [Caerostris extrusa]